ncbi:MAG: glycosyltransferase family A protein [Nocardioidaceae bacterium]
MSTESVTVVIATRNRPEMLRESIAAVWAQDHPGPIEVVVVFDQSEPDPSLATVLGNRSVRVVTNTRSPGLAGARNTGIEASEAPFVAFCDDDDYWAPSKVREQLALAAAHPQAGLVTCGIIVQYDGERHARVLERDLVCFEDLLRDRHTELHPSTFLLRRSVLVDRIGLVDEEVPGGFGEDYDFLLRSAKAHPVVNLRRPLVVVRWGGQSFFFQRWDTMAGGLTWLLERHPGFEGSPRGSARLRGQIAFAHAAVSRRGVAARWAAGAVRRSWREPRAYLALAVAVGVVTPARVMTTLHRHGRGI